MQYWVLPRNGRPSRRELTFDEQRVLEALGWERFIGRGARPAWVEYAEDLRDVGRLRMTLIRQEESGRPFDCTAVTPGASKQSEDHPDGSGQDNAA
jgi:hypothetical protein